MRLDAGGASLEPVRGFSAPVRGLLRPSFQHKWYVVGTAIPRTAVQIVSGVLLIGFGVFVNIIIINE